MIGGRLDSPEFLILCAVLLGLFILLVFAWAKIFSKAGYSSALCILMLIPLVSLITFLWFAFSEWPVRRQKAPGEPRPGA